MAGNRSSEEVKALYDAACKKVLSEKGIAAHILKGCMEEYKDVPIDDIIHKYIQGKPEIDRIMIQEESVLTRIGNEQTEDSSEREGTVFQRGHHKTHHKHRGAERLPSRLSSAEAGNLLLQPHDFQPVWHCVCEV